MILFLVFQCLANKRHIVILLSRVQYFILFYFQVFIILKHDLGVQINADILFY